MTARLSKIKMTEFAVTSHVLRGIRTTDSPAIGSGRKKQWERVIVLHENLWGRFMVLEGAHFMLSRA
jgi:hypothetical protein